MAKDQLLGGQNASSTDSLDLLLGLAGEETSLDDDGLLGESSLAKNLEESSSGAVNDWSLGLLTGILDSGLLGDKGPQLV